MRLVFLSDTHERHDTVTVPDGDVLIHCGDFTHRGERAAVRAFNAWGGAQKHGRKIVVAGNHERTFDPKMRSYDGTIREELTAWQYVEHGPLMVDGLRLFLSPYTPEFCGWAFMNGQREQARLWAQIPAGIDVLVTHGPPYGVLDKTEAGDFAGCRALNDAVRLIRPRVHAFGHIHEGYGAETHNGIHYVNAAICDEYYRPVNQPIVVDL